eukprot:TRINITY_DN8907_c0_g2_i1.p1 TRINITY_DN8907_c0_g2~~TRINITY_DN8907_c0_g2_i1.p1  ORF type:complete len:300 (+),score=47.46 TRINITY_DN8907_c0_g2_i1:27-902(+)
MSLVLLHDSFLLCSIFSYLGKKDKSGVSLTCKRWNDVVRNNTSIPFNRTFFKKMWKHRGWLVALDDDFLWVVLPSAPSNKGVIDYDYDKILEHDEKRRAGEIIESLDVFSYRTSIHPPIMIKLPLNYGQSKSISNNDNNDIMGRVKDNNNDDDGVDDGCRFWFKQQRNCMLVRFRDQTIHHAPSLGIPHWDCFPAIDSEEYNILQDFTLDAFEGGPFSFSTTSFGGLRVAFPIYDYEIYFFRYDNQDHAIQFSCKGNSYSTSMKYCAPNVPFYTPSLSHVVRKLQPSSAAM